MKIGIDGRAAKWYRGTGIGTYTYQIINKLSNINTIDDYTIFLPEDSSLNLNNKLKVEFTNSTSNNNFWEEISLPNIISNNNLDLYHIPQNGVGLSKNLSCAKVITLHDIIPLRMPETVSDRYLNIFNNQMPEIVNNSDGIITVSEFSKKDIAKEFNYPENKIFVTHLAAEDIYKPLSKSSCKDLLKKSYGIDCNFLLYVGGFSPRKNILGIIEAFSLLNNKTKRNLKLIITGKKGISYDKYKSRTIELNISESVIFTDFVPLADMPLFYNAAEMLIYPSHYEGFGLPPLEAMACGTPVITSNVTSLPEIYNNAAMLIDPSDVYQLKSAIENLILDPQLRETLIQKGFSTSENYSWEKTTLKTIQSYNKVFNSFNNS